MPAGSCPRFKGGTAGLRYVFYWDRMVAMNSSAPESGRIHTHPSILGGKPYIRDTRLSVEFLQGLMATGWSPSRILEVYQYLDSEDLKALGVGPGLHLPQNRLN